MAKKSAGILVYRFGPGGCLEVLIGHMDGPFWKNKDDRGYSIIKGEIEEDEEDSLSVAKREFVEETGLFLEAELVDLGEFKQPSGKRIYAWMCKQDIDISKFRPGEFEMEWPRGSGTMQSFPEIDRLEWHTMPTAVRKVVKGQVAIIERLTTILNYDFSGDPDSDGAAQGSLF